MRRTREGTREPDWLAGMDRERVRRGEVLRNGVGWEGLESEIGRR